MPSLKRVLLEIHGHYMFDDFDMIKVTAAIIVEKRKVLIAMRKPTARLANLWEFPGGKLEDGETPEQCLERELHEEFEIEVEVGEYLGTSEYEYEFGAIHLMAYRTQVLAGEFKLNDHAEIAWVSADEIEGFEFAPADVPFVQMIKDGRIKLNH